MKHIKKVVLVLVICSAVFVSTKAVNYNVTGLVREYFRLDSPPVEEQLSRMGSYGISDKVVGYITGREEWESYQNTVNVAYSRYNLWYSDLNFSELEPAEASAITKQYQQLSEEYQEWSTAVLRVSKAGGKVTSTQQLTLLDGLENAREIKELID